MVYFRFFFYILQTFYRPVPYPMRKKKKITKKSFLITIYEKSKNFTVIVSQLRVLGQKNYRGGPPNAPPAFIGLKFQLKYIFYDKRHI